MDKKAIVLITLLMVTGVTAFTGSALAQENTTTTQEQDNTTIIEIDERTKVVGYHFEDSTLHVTIKSEYTRRIVLSDMFVKGSGAQELPRKSLTISKGLNEITFDVTTWNGNKGATIATSNGAIAISKSGESGMSLPGTFGGETVMLFFGSGTLMGVALVGVISWKKQIDYTSEINRIL